MQQNNDQHILDAQRVDINDSQPILSQALRIAAYDEFEAYNTYNNILLKFGNVLPFSNIINSEIMHYNEILVLLQKYGIEAPIVSQTQIDLPNTLQECCEMAVVAEIDNIKLYNNLLAHVSEPDVRDLFYRLQAASYNNHLPAFRTCVFNFYNQNNSKNRGNELQNYQGLIEDVVNGNVDQNKIMSMLSSMNLSLLSGLVIGGLGGITLNDLIDKKEK